MSNRQQGFHAVELLGLSSRAGDEGTMTQKEVQESDDTYQSTEDRD